MSEALEKYESVTLQPLEFDAYRSICDETTDEFRKIGIQDYESYQAAINDERSVFIAIEGTKLPLLTPIEYEKMYNEKRCKDLTTKDNVLLLSLPLGFLTPDRTVEDFYGLNLDNAAVVIEDFGSIEKNSSNLSERLRGTPLEGLQAHIFKNPDLVDFPENDSAWMAAYSVVIESSKEGDMPYSAEVNLRSSVLRYWQEICEKDDKELVPIRGISDGTFMLSSDQLASNPEIIDDLWSISEFGFGEVLGAHHPVSMEFTREFFDSQIVSDNTITVVRYVNGEAVCFGFLALDMENNDWLSTDSSIMKEEAAEAEANKRAHIHFHELISKGARGAGYSLDILHAFFQVAHKCAREYSVFFESTNLSSLYIPKIIEAEANLSALVSVKSPIKTLGRLSYWAALTDS